MKQKFEGKTIAVIASGPSLTKQQCQAIERVGIRTIAVNQSWKRAPFCDVIYGGDFVFWNKYREEITINAERWTCCQQSARMYGINWHYQAKKKPYNSGLRAIELAILWGVKRIILLGFDASIENGIHWHGPHEKTKNPTKDKCRMWVNQFEKLDCKGVEIVNCSPGTAINAFKKMNLGDALETFMQ